MAPAASHCSDKGVEQPVTDRPASSPPPCPATTKADGMGVPAPVPDSVTVAGAGARGAALVVDQAPPGAL